jgi:hypothetical protein
MTDVMATSHSGKHRRSRLVPSAPSADGPVYQKVLNEDWPPPAIARTLKNARASIEVEARLILDRDGETWMPGRALRWTRHHVLVEVADPRLEVSRIWLAPHDLHQTGTQPRTPRL